VAGRGLGQVRSFLKYCARPVSRYPLALRTTGDLVEYAVVVEKLQDLNDLLVRVSDLWPLSRGWNVLLRVDLCRVRLWFWLRPRFLTLPFGGIHVENLSRSSSWHFVRRKGR
jgi:hypothetical protein